jgi:LDH2 family malate/lactate/ureidoglycolate dehydrogenase
MMESKDKVYRYDDLLRLASELLGKAGMAVDIAAVVAEVLVEGDLLGHTTHGLALLPAYLEELEQGTMTGTGIPEVIADRRSAVTLDGRYLPGPWLIHWAMDLAFERIRQHPVVTVVIRRSHHTAALAAYAKRVTDRGYIFLMTCSDPSVRSVAPFGGLEPLYTPNPIAAGFPTDGEPVIIDISTSTTAVGVTNRRYNEGRLLPNPWLLDNSGVPSDDPSVLFTDPPGSILPLGGMDLGYKGYALGVLVEALTAALSGSGRSDGIERWGASVFLQIIDPQGFSGIKAFTRETQWLAEACRKNPIRTDDPPVRLPGERALKLRSEQLAHGLRLYPSIMPAIEPWAQKLGVSLPSGKNG